MNNPKDLAEYFHLPLERAEEILSFLLKTKLCEKQGEKIFRGPQHTFVPADSIFIKGHHRNWRHFSISKVDTLDPESELMYTAPISLSEEAYAIVRSRLLSTIQDALKLISPSKDETIACLNIDLLKI